MQGYRIPGLGVKELTQFVGDLTRRASALCHSKTISGLGRGELDVPQNVPDL